MDLAFIERLMQVFERSSLLELEYGDASGRVRLARDARGAPAAAPSGQPTASSGQPAPGPDAARHAVRASFPGVFYRRSAPDQPPLVEVGDVVEEGRTLGMLEAMKLFNTVEADVAGRVVEIPAADGASVDAGAALFVIEPR